MLGYLIDEKGSVELQEKFVRRMSGLMRLYSAIIVAHPKLWHPFGIKNALDWLQIWLNQGMFKYCLSLGRENHVFLFYTLHGRSSVPRCIKKDL